MFGAFTLGSFVLGIDIWGGEAPVRDNPDIDGAYIATISPVGTLTPLQIETSQYIPEFAEEGEFTRIK